MKSISNDLHRSDTDLRNDILEEVRNHLSQMKPDIISSIAEEVLCRIDNLYASRIERLEDRVSELERRIGDAQKTPVRQKTSTVTADTAKKLIPAGYMQNSASMAGSIIGMGIWEISCTGSGRMAPKIHS